MPWLAEIHTEAETAWWIANIVLPNQRVWLAEDSDRIVGIAALKGQVLEQLYVLPDAQRQGIGSALLQHAIEHAGETLELWTFQRNTTARTFYEQRGFVTVEFTDGDGNEEHEPDVRYALTMKKPILFVDIDGVLNPFGGGCPEGYLEYDLFPEDEEPIRICPVHGEWLIELSMLFDLVWATGWVAAEREILGTVLVLPEFYGAAEMPPVPFEPADKVVGVSSIAKDRACAWIDDLVTPEAELWADGRVAPTLLIETRSSEGMTREHVDALLAWRRQLLLTEDQK